MGWGSSKIFRPFLADALGNVSALDMDADALLVALFNNSITPSQDVSTANSAYNAGQWANTNEVSDTNWAAGGRQLAGQSLDSSIAATVFLDGTDLAGAGAVTLADVYGCQVYDNTLAGKNGICYNYFGGVQAVTGGTFTIVWHGNGLFRFTL